jgi:hypothetical protein
MKKTYKKALIVLLFLLIVLIVIGFFSETSEKADKNNENSRGNNQLFPDCPGVTKKFLDLHPNFKTNPNLLRE